MWLFSNFIDEIVLYGDLFVNRINATNLFSTITHVLMSLFEVIDDINTIMNNKH